MILPGRIALELLATAVMASWAATVQTGETTTLQKCPIALPQSVAPATLQLQSWEGVPVVTVSLDESRIERAAIATGLNANVISPDASQRLKLGKVGGRIKIDALASTTAADQAEIQRFRAGTLDLPKIAFGVADVPGLLSLRPHPDAPAAWLGTPFLAAFQVMLDPVAKTVTLTKTTGPAPRPRQASSAPLVLRDNRPYVRVSIPGVKPFLALIDTASPGTVIPTDVGDKLRLKPLRVEPISRREGKPGKAAVIVVPKLSVGKAEWKSAHVFYITPDSNKEYDRSFAVLGMDFIAQFTVTIDFAHSQVVFAPLSKPTPAPAPGA